MQYHIRNAIRSMPADILQQHQWK